MTKRWSSTRSGDGTKRQASKAARKEQSVEDWLREQGAVESVRYDEETGEPYRSFKIDLKK